MLEVRIMPLKILNNLKNNIAYEISQIRQSPKSFV